MANKKNKGQKLDLGTFLQSSSNAGGSWADDVDLPTAPSGGGGGGGLGALPTGPRGGGSGSSGGRQDSFGGGGGGFSGGGGRGSSTASMDVASIPHDPPFNAFVGNLSFDVSQQDLETFFGQELKIKGVRIIMDQETQQPKGFGYVEFMDRASLISALAMSGEMLQKRAVRINYAEEKGDRRTRPEDDPKYASSWRNANPRPQPVPERRGGDRDFSSRGGDRDFSSRGGDNRDHDRPHTGGWAAGFTKNEPRPAGGAFARREDSSSSFKRDFVSRDVAPAPSSEPAVPAGPAKPKINPFGAAAPRDEAAIQKQIEDRRLAREAAEKKVADAEKAKVAAEKAEAAAAEKLVRDAEREKKEAEKSTNATNLEKISLSPKDGKPQSAFNGKPKRDHDNTKPPLTNVPAGNWRVRQEGKPKPTPFRRESSDRSVESGGAGGYRKASPSPRQGSPVTSPSGGSDAGSEGFVSAGHGHQSKFKKNNTFPPKSGSEIATHPPAKTAAAPGHAVAAPAAAKQHISPPSNPYDLLEEVIR